MWRWKSASDLALIFSPFFVFYFILSASPFQYGNIRTYVMYLVQDAISDWVYPMHTLTMAQMREARAIPSRIPAQSYRSAAEDGDSRAMAGL
jgi:hypothetical protein